MTRLSGLYPLSLLEINYRCHPQSLSWPTSQGKITASDQNVAAERVGNAWDTFTAPIHLLKRSGLVRKRLLAIDVNRKSE